MSFIVLDTSNPDNAANVVGRAAILFARISGYVAENGIREQLGEALAYNSDCFESAIDECFPELRVQRNTERTTGGG